MINSPLFKESSLILFKAQPLYCLYKQLSRIEMVSKYTHLARNHLTEHARKIDDVLIKTTQIRLTIQK
ncbi:hypothetical protein GWJ07_02435 [Proteus sp. G2639]|nr:hypothetical protein [Proteus sp. G2626]NBN58534.1 hypothetical protein [Proteus sp. G2639]NBN74733.1 hypothetical protein [Proteus sp. G2615]